MAGETGRRRDECGREAVALTQPLAPCDGERTADGSEEVAMQQRDHAQFRLGGQHYGAPSPSRKAPES